MLHVLKAFAILIAILFSGGSQAEDLIIQNANLHYESREEKLDFNKNTVLYQSLSTKNSSLRQIATKFGPAGLNCFAGNIQFQAKDEIVGIIIDQRSNINNIRINKVAKGPTESDNPFNMMVLQLSRGRCRVNLEITYYIAESSTWRQASFSKDFLDDINRNVDLETNRLSAQERRNSEELYAKSILAEKTRVLSQLKSNGYTIPPHGDPFVSTKGLSESRNIVGLSVEFQGSRRCLFTSGNIEIRENTASVSYFSSTPDSNNKNWFATAEVKYENTDSTSIALYNNQCAFRFSFRISSI